MYNYAGLDYIVNLTNTSTRIYTVTFTARKTKSTEYVIQTAFDHIMEGTEYFRLRINAIRFIGQSGGVFRAADAVKNNFADVILTDDDCKLGSSAWK